MPANLGGHGPFQRNQGPFQRNHGSFKSTDIRRIIGGGWATAEAVGTWGRKAPGANPAMGSTPECVLSHIQCFRRGRIFRQPK